jgi:uncharacterized protein YbjQ (UPF0145 family)
MITVTTETVEGQRIVKVLGMVEVLESESDGE